LYLFKTAHLSEKKLSVRIELTRILLGITTDSQEVSSKKFIGTKMNDP